MTVKELAKDIGCQYAEANALMKSEGFPSFRIGRRLYVTAEDWNDWRASHYGGTIQVREPKVQPAKRRRRSTHIPEYVLRGSYTEILAAARKN